MPLHYGLLYLQRGIQFVFHVLATNDLVLAYPSHHCLLHNLLFALPFKGRRRAYKTRWLSTGRSRDSKGPCDRNVLPTQVCCSADLLTF